VGSVISCGESAFARGSDVGVERERPGLRRIVITEKARAFGPSAVVVVPLFPDHVVVPNVGPVTPSARGGIQQFQGLGEGGARPQRAADENEKDWNQPRRRVAPAPPIQGSSPGSSVFLKHRTPCLFLRFSFWSLIG
jgi:hypothetical protein